MNKNSQKQELQPVKMVTVPEEGLLAMVAAALKDRVLFPEKLETAKKFMEKATFKVV